MNRFEWFLGAVLGVLLVIVTGFLLTVWLAPAQAESHTQLVSDQQKQTAQTAYTAVENVAHDWAGDARLLGATATWPPGSDLSGGAATWAFTFYSEEQRATALIVALENKADLVGANQVHGSFNPVNIDTWSVDSSKAVTEMLAAGGQAFLDSQGDVTMILSLTASERLEWESILFSGQSEKTFSLRLDAGTGERLFAGNSQP